jgi:hypothetical protein
MSEARTKLDLLYQEALGDIDALLTRIENMDHGVTEAIGALDKAGEVFRTDVIHLQAAVKSELLDYQERIQAIGSNKFHQEVNQLTKAFLERVENEMKESIRKEVGRPVENAVDDLRGFQWKLPLYCLLAGALGAGAALLAYDHFSTDEYFTVYGKATGQVWDKLPQASQKLILDARGK